MQYDHNLIRGSLDLLVLAVLTEGPMYGHLIQQRIRQASGKSILLPAGTLYPLLHRMEAAGWIKVKQVQAGQRLRRWYSLTRAGCRRLQQQSDQWQSYADCVVGLLGPALGRLTDGGQEPHTA